MFVLGEKVRRIDRPLVRVIERFPSYWGQIRRLADDERFADLCRDYVDAVELYRYWREQANSRALNRARDYATAVAELEAEISRELTDDSK